MGHIINMGPMLNEYLKTLNCKKYVILGMMKIEHEKRRLLKDISSFVIDIPNQPNAIKGKDLLKKFKNIPNVKYEESIEKAIRSIPLKRRSCNNCVLFSGRSSKLELNILV